MYKSIHFSINGDYVTDNERDTVTEVWDAVNNMGSRWIFYPLPFVIKSGADMKRGRIVSACDGFEHLKGLSIATARNYIEHNSTYIELVLS